MSMLEDMVPSAQLFLRDYWGREAFLAKRDDRAKRDAMLDTSALLQDIQHLLNSHAIAPPYLRIVRSGERAAPAELWSEEGQIGHSKTAKRLRWPGVLAELRRGSTLVLDDFQEQCEPVRRACIGLAEELAVPVNAVLFITPPGKQGLHLHLDNKDVFALQLAGSKSWTVHAQRRPVPRESGVILEELDEESATTWNLGVGDCLYIPAGAPHSATAVPGQLSIHLSFAGRPLYWSDLIESVVGNVLGESQFLGTVPPIVPDRRLLHEATELLVAELCQRLKDSATAVHVDQIVDGRWRDSLPDRSVEYLIRDLLTVSAPNGKEDVRLSLGDSVAVGELDSDTGEPIVGQGGRKLKLTPELYPLLLKLKSAPLPMAAFTSVLGAIHGQQAVATLIRHGVLVVVRVPCVREGL